MHRHTPLVAVVIALLAAAASPQFNDRFTEPDDTPLLGATLEPIGWEYAELRFTGNDAVLVTRADAFFLKGPEGREAREFIKLDNDNIRARQSIRVFHLTRVGSHGWEVVDVSAGNTGSCLLKRRYRVDPAPGP